MDLSEQSIYTSLTSLLTRSRDFQVWYEEHEVMGQRARPLAHAVRPSTGEHYVVRLKDTQIVVDDWMKLVCEPKLVVELEDPEGFARLEAFFGVRSADDPARPVDPMTVIAAMID